MRAWTVRGLVVVMLWAGQVQAWHGPSHVDDLTTTPTHQESACVLGVNGHGTALPTATALCPAAPAAATAVDVATRDAAIHAGVRLLPPLRGPPRAFVR